MIVDIILILLLVFIIFKIKNEFFNEPFIVADAQDFHNYAKLKARMEAEPDSFDDQNICKAFEYEEIPKTLDGYFKAYCQVNKKIPYYEFIGYNYGDYSDSVTLKDFDIRILSQTGRGLPLNQRKPNIVMPSNYAFGTPCFK